MFRLFLRLFIKNVIQDRWIFVLNMLGLTIGIAVSIIMYLWVIEELSYDRFHKDSDNIYRIVRLNKASSGLKKSIFSPIPLPYSLKKDFPQIEEAVAIYTGHMDKDFHIEDKMIKLKIEYTTEDFFKVFSFPLINRSGDNFFPDGRSIVISKDCAIKVFGDTDCVGKDLNMFFYGDTEFIVSAVVDIPQNSHIHFEVLIPLTSNNVLSGMMNDWYRIKTVNYIKLNTDSRVTAKQYKEMQNYLFKKTKEASLLHFQALEDIHLHTNFTDSYSRNNIDIRYVRVFIIALVLVYILSNLNFIILSTARSEKRRKELGLKKLYGLQKSKLISQFVLETIIITSISIIIAVILIKISLPMMSTIFNKELVLSINFELVLYALVSISITSLISLSYLSIYLSSFRAIDLLSGIKVKYLKQNVNRIITPLQMIISFFFIMSFLCILLQLRYMEEKDKGIDLSNIIGVKTAGFIYDYEAVKIELMKNPDIFSVTASGMPPVNYNFDKFKNHKRKKR